MFELFTDRARRVILFAREASERLMQTSIDTEHILLGLLRERSGLAAEIFSRRGIDVSMLMNDVKGVSEKGHNLMIKGSLPFSQNGKNVLDFSVEEAKNLKNKYVNTEHILLGLLKEKKGKASMLLSKLGFDLVTLREEIQTVSKSYAKNTDQAVTPTLDEFGRDLTKLAMDGKLDPVIGRSTEITRLIQILGRRIKNNAVIIGEPGVGKTAIVEGLALKMASEDVPDFLRNKRLFSLELGNVVAGTKYRGQFEERMKNLIKEIETDGNVIIFIDEIHTIVGAGAAEGSIDASNMLKPALARGVFQCIGATTLSEFRKNFEKDGALNRRFQTISVDQPDADETVQILDGIKRFYEDFHKVFIPHDVLEEITRLTDRYITEKFQPDKSIDVLDEACSRLKLATRTMPDDMVRIKNKLEQLKGLRDEKLRANDYDNIQKYSKDVERWATKLSVAQKEWEEELDLDWPTLTIENISEVVAHMTGVPVQKLQTDDMARIANIDKDIKEFIIGQDEAVDALSRSVKRSFAGLSNPARPLGSFIFMGPTGVGKTEVAKKLAETVFGSESSLIRIDMTEYMERFNSSRLIGAPPGYVGYEEGGKLTEQVRRKPYSVVLFDEIEKAHPEVLNILLQILDDGHINDSLGHKVNFKNTIIIMTSNLGTKLSMNRKTLGFDTKEESNNEIDYDVFSTNAHRELKDRFPPEFINRVDSLVVFKPLGKAELIEIIDLQLIEINKRLEIAGKQLTIDQDVKEHLLSGEYEYSYGARPIKRLLQSKIEDPLSEILLEGKFAKRKNLKVKMINDEIVFK
ncbi:ATPase AAA-2 domain protein [Denitrovibrio acetiphilus DSM 12809]|uniref:ATPase AAA-2 domain protein n=1 Tax=Denitrovibrio acetiphilus (strain DSM 12809 / NBRC 114555 / N2460) TaxID=522772 RepID=D4H304_DENA2|nr:ATP-dependent Clp protease ATP-binding subunit [Denitrovibrio acetiphilus]ADD69027.1 ATPase AAA-2 domain protein [Denitrovibrio acetiphilus DSM 12809]